MVKLCYVLPLAYIAITSTSGLNIGLPRLDKGQAVISKSNRHFSNKGYHSSFFKDRIEKREAFFAKKEANPNSEPSEVLNNRKTEHEASAEKSGLKNSKGNMADTKEIGEKSVEQYYDVDDDGDDNYKGRMELGTSESKILQNGLRFQVRNNRMQPTSPVIYFDEQIQKDDGNSLQRLTPTKEVDGIFDQYVKIGKDKWAGFLAISNCEKFGKLLNLIETKLARNYDNKELQRKIEDLEDTTDYDAKLEVEYENSYDDDGYEHIDNKHDIKDNDYYDNDDCDNGGYDNDNYDNIEHEHEHEHEHTASDHFYDSNDEVYDYDEYGMDFETDDAAYDMDCDTDDNEYDKDDANADMKTGYEYSDSDTFSADDLEFEYSFDKFTHPTHLKSNVVQKEEFKSFQNMLKEVISYWENEDAKKILKSANVLSYKEFDLDDDKESPFSLKSDKGFFQNVYDKKYQLKSAELIDNYTLKNPTKKDMLESFDPEQIKTTEQKAWLKENAQRRATILRKLLKGELDEKLIKQDIVRYRENEIFLDQDENEFLVNGGMKLQSTTLLLSIFFFVETVLLT